MSTVVASTTEQFRARLGELMAMQSRIPYDLAAAEERLIAARDRAREARQSVIASGRLRRSAKPRDRS
jgi:hypothetical protein